MYLLQLVQALKYESFSDIQGGLDPGSKRDSQGLSDDGALDRSEPARQVKPPLCQLDRQLRYLFLPALFDLLVLPKEAAMKPLHIVLQQLVLGRVSLPSPSDPTEQR